MAEGQRATGTSNPIYNLSSVLFHALEGGASYDTYVEDAEREGDRELVEFFEQVRDEDSRRADRALQLLAERTRPPPRGRKGRHLVALRRRRRPMSRRGPGPRPERGSILLCCNYAIQKANTKPITSTPKLRSPMIAQRFTPSCHGSLRRSFAPAVSSTRAPASIVHIAPTKNKTTPARYHIPGY